jgi:hypothetical protein
MTESRITIRLRPFDKLLTAENNALQCSGRIERDEYVLTMGASVHRLPIVGTGSDKWGVYAIVEESETPLAAGFVLTVERNLQEPDFDAGLTFEPGGRIALTRPAQIDPALLAGIDPKTVHVIAPPDASVSIYFEPSGKVDGYGMAGYPDAPPGVRRVQ